MYSQRKTAVFIKHNTHLIYVSDREYCMPYSSFPAKVPSIDDAGVIFDILNAKMLDEAIEFDRLNDCAQVESKAVAVRAACSTYSVGRNKVEADCGTGYWDHYRFSESLYMSVCHANYKNDTILHIPGENIVKIRIVLTGSLLNAFGEVLVSGPGGTISAHDANHGSSYSVKGGIDTKFLIVHCKPDFPTVHFGLGPMDLPKLFGCFTDRNHDCVPIDRKFALTSAMHRAANDIMNACDRPRGSVQNAYLFSKCLEISGLVIEVADATNDGSESSISLKSADIKRLHTARQILEDRFSSPPSVKDLARMVGVNQTKLKAGFKAVTGSTISQFILKFRMEQAMEMLLANTCTISEISYDVGYGYPANFALAFKKYFGLLPKDVRRARTSA